MNTHFYTRHLATILHFKKFKKIALSIAPLLQHAYWFLHWMRCAIFQINANLLVIYNTLIFLHKRICNPPSVDKNLALSIAKVILSSSQTFFQTSTFYYLFTFLTCWLFLTILQLNTDFLNNQLKTIFTQNTLHPSFISKTK